MSYLNVTNVSHSFGGRQILENGPARFPSAIWTSKARWKRA